MIAADTFDVEILGTPHEWLDILGVAAAVLAALVPLIFFLFERRDRKAAEQSAADARSAAADERLTAQARAVAVFMETQLRSPATTGRLIVINTSGAPIFDFGALVSIGDIPAGGGVSPHATGGSQVVYPGAPGNWHSIDLSERFLIRPDLSFADSIEVPATVMSYTFTDARGHRWLAAGYGENKGKLTLTDKMPFRTFD